MLDPTEARQLLDAVDVTTPGGLRDLALIGLIVFSFARIGAAPDHSLPIPDGTVS